MAGIGVTSWNAADIPEGGEALSWWGGFFDHGMRWADYLDEFGDEQRPYLEAARASAVERGIRANGIEHQNDGITPVFSDGRHFALTMRAWGDFMAAVWAQAEDRDYHYMDFYM